MIVRLLVSNDKANVKKVVLRSDTMIGRSSDCNLRIASKEVSRKHCSILLSERAVRVRDLGSANGTFLNGLQLEANVDVAAPPGSELEVGNVRFVISYDTPATADLEASTAEVPNAVLQARLARAAEPTPVAGLSPAQPQPETRPPTNGTADAEAVDSPLDTDRSTSGETAREDADSATAEETFNAADSDDDDAGRTLQEPSERPVDDDTFALKESDVPETDEADPAAVAPELPGADETVSMQVDDVIIDTQAPPAAKEPEPPAAEAQRKGWKSMFGLLGGNKGKTAEPEPDEPEAAELPDDAVDSDAERRLETAPDRSSDPERNRKTVPEFELSPREDDPDDQGTHPEFELPPEEEKLTDTVHIAGDESLGSKPGDQSSQEAAADDTNLQDFFRKMSKE